MLPSVERNLAAMIVVHGDIVNGSNVSGVMASFK